MTIKEIATTANVDRTTVLRWMKKVIGAFCTVIGAKCTEAEKTKVEADFTLEETIAIVRAGGNDTLADLLLANAKESQKPTAKTPKLPNGSQLREIRVMFERQAIDKSQVARLLGLLPSEPSTPTSPGAVAIIPQRDPERVESTLRGLMPQSDKGRGAVYAVATRAVASEESKKAVEKMNGKFPFQDGPL